MSTNIRQIYPPPRRLLTSSLRSVFTFVLTDGGTADLFWGFIVIALGMMLVYASIAEMSSMCPTAGMHM